MRPQQRRRIFIVTGIALVVVAMAIVVATQPGAPLRMRWELSRVRRVEQEKVVFLSPGARMTGTAVEGWTVPALQPAEPVWRYKAVRLRLLPGCEIVLPSGQRMTVDSSSESTAATALLREATAAMTVRAASVDRGREYVCRQVTVGTPDFAPIAEQLRAGAQDQSKPATGETAVAARARFVTLGGLRVLLLAIPQKKTEGYLGPGERQYALIEPNTLLLKESETGVSPITLAEAKRLVKAHPDEFVRADLEQRGNGVFVVQLRVR